MYGFVFFFLLLHEKIHILKKICLWEVQTFLKLGKKNTKTQNTKEYVQIGLSKKSFSLKCYRILNFRGLMLTVLLFIF